MDPRVLVVAPRLDVGGTEIHLARVLPVLRRMGLDVSLFVIARGGSLDQTVVDAGVPLLGIEVSGSRVMRSLQAARELRCEIGRTRPNILHFFLSEPYLVGSLASVGKGGTVRIMSRRSLSHYQRNHPLLAWIERRLHRRVDALIGNSRAVATQLIAECGESAKVAVIHNGIELPPATNPDRRDACRRELGIPSDAFVIAVVANLIPYKGHEDLIDALALVRGRLRGPWRLMLIGRDEGIGAGLKKKATALGIGSNILWLNEQPNPQALLAAADLGVLPSHEEGFSNSLIEKMAQGMPVIATRVGGNSDAVVDDECGRLVPVKDPAALGAAIASVYEDAGLRARMGAAARVRVERFFSLKVCIQRYINLYQGIIRKEATPVAELIDPLGAGCATAAASLSSGVGG
jgi:glycosyltransferase involved in cell wall biosynthesis